MSSSVQAFAKEAHTSYIQHLEEKETNTFEYCVTEHLRMSGMYWGLTAMDLLNEIDKMNRDKILQFVRDSYHEEEGGFSGAPNHDPHILYTLSAVQLLVLLTDNIEEFLSLEQIEKIGSYIGSLQKEDGSFAGDQWGEVDTRFSYCALNCLALLGLLETCSNYRGDKINNRKFINVEKAVQYVLSCQNFDGGFGVCPGAESHAGQIFTCIGALSIGKALDRIDQDTLCWWLCERQCDNGGLNGRPEKLADVCYSWWVLSALGMMDRIHWIDEAKLHDYICNCQDTEKGGISDKPNNAVDVFHTFFGIAGLSLLGYGEKYALKTIDPTFALPVGALKKIGIQTPYTLRYDQ
ncbi:hypothetical protein FDP41_004038 [Naegleria fowleri]|uniref:Geranylgeranyl transferase type-2 subunit beta n=1 Tax=Naegleria fowleri TaxID=5763 RepID=A0A6A5BFX4_NAEFO|nr:uncharacterized protein FDP41_004038 [Naegleria fowleri]KAF0976743.1 hypothetical protein FDP41_004038 [Naegleria fowleri]CAG4711568.1 unnamed protein product [Naegleria fowleri]